MEDNISLAASFPVELVSVNYTAANIEDTRNRALFTYTGDSSGTVFGGGYPYSSDSRALYQGKTGYNTSGGYLELYNKGSADNTHARFSLEFTNQYSFIYNNVECQAYPYFRYGELLWEVTYKCNEDVRVMVDKGKLITVSGIPADSLLRAGNTYTFSCRFGWEKNNDDYIGLGCYPYNSTNTVSYLNIQFIYDPPPSVPPVPRETKVALKQDGTLINPTITQAKYNDKNITKIVYNGKEFYI